LGRVLAHLGQATEATQRLRQGLALLPPEPSRLRISALGNLGNIYCVQGDVENGLEHYRQVLAEAEALNDFWAMGEVWINLGIELRLAGRWAEALEQFEVAYQQAERLGSADQQMRAALSLGNLYLRQGDWDLAQHHLLKSRQLAQTRGWKARQLYVIIALAELYLRREDWAPLEGLWAEALRFSEETGVREPLPELHVQRVAVYLRQNTPAEALTEAEHALALARELNDEVAQGLSLRALGQAHWATGQQAAATTAYQHSLELLTDRDPYEAAHTQLSWGVDHWVSGDSAQTATLLRQALTTFQRLGARRDTERATQLLQRLT
jgi:tetratricopeptide (TPR) repeat protein